MKTTRLQRERRDELARPVAHAFRQQFGFITGFGYEMRWGFEEGRLNREELDWLLAINESEDPGPVSEWLPAILSQSLPVLVQRPAEAAPQQSRLF